MKRMYLLLLLYTLPANAQLFFVLPPVESLKPSEFRLDMGAVHGKYYIIGRDQNRTYAPDLKIHAQFAKRVGFGFEAFGVSRSESLHDNQPASLEDNLFTGGDFVLTSWVDLMRRKKPWQNVKAFFRVKIPSADDRKGAGTDEADLFLGLTSNYQGSQSSLAGVVRLDIISRPDFQDQWDYITMAARYTYQLRPKLEVLTETWYRFRSTNETGLISAGLLWHMTRRGKLELLAGDGFYSRFELNPDSRLEYQYSLQYKWHGSSNRLRKWLGYANRP